MDNILNSIENVLYSIFVQPFQDVLNYLNQYIDRLTLIYILGIVLGLLIILYAILKGKEERKINVLNKLLNINRSEKGFLDVILDKFTRIQKFEDDLQKRISVLNKDLTARKITKRICFSIFLSIAFAIYLKNVLAIIPLILIGYNIPIIMLDIKIKKKRHLLEEQLGNAIKLFVTEFTTNKSVVVALNNILKDVKAPLKYEFERLLRRLNSGEPYNECLMDFAYRLDNKWAYLFSKLVINYLDSGTDFSSHLIKITEEITEEKIRFKENTTELTALRMTNLMINGAIPFVYILNKIVNPEQARVFTDTQTGRLIMIFVIVGTFLSLILGLKIEN